MLHGIDKRYNNSMTTLERAYVIGSLNGEFFDHCMMMVPATEFLSADEFRDFLLASMGL